VVAWACWSVEKGKTKTESHETERREQPTSPNDAPIRGPCPGREIFLEGASVDSNPASDSANYH